MRLTNLLTVVPLVVFLLSCSIEKNNTKPDVEKDLNYCSNQITKTLAEISGKDMMPRNIMDSLNNWKLVPVDISEWTVGFWPGILWYNYENTQNKKDADIAVYYTELLNPLTKLPAYDHDLGFQIFCSYGNAYRLTGNNKYKQMF